MPDLGERQTLTIKARAGRELCLEIAGEDREPTILVCAGTPNSRRLYDGWVDDALAGGPD